MFGDVTFAQTPFAALGGATFAASISEAGEASSVAAAPSVVRGGLQDEASSGAATVISSGNIMVATQASTASGEAVTNFAASTLTAAQAEASAGVATQTAIGTMLAAQDEAATATATQSAITTVLATIAEASAGMASVTGSRLYSVAISEAASGAATQTTTISATASVAELATALATCSAVKTLNVYPQGLQLTVSVGNVLVWGTIDDIQNPDWQNIDNVQTPGWTQIPS